MRVIVTAIEMMTTSRGLLGGMRLSRPARYVGLSSAVQRAQEACPSPFARRLTSKAEGRPPRGRPTGRIGDVTFVEKDRANTRQNWLLV
jgi:hypothetical protein